MDGEEAWLVRSKTTCSSGAPEEAVNNSVAGWSLGIEAVL